MAPITAGKYHEVTNNCTDAVEAALKAAGVKHSTGLMPSTLFNNNIKIRRDESGIVTMGILDFLLNPNSLEW